MKVLIDIAHPAHIHYFRNFSSLFELKGHQCLFTLRDKGIIVELADHYKLNYRIRSVECTNKMEYIFNSIKNIYKFSKVFKPDLFLDMGTVMSAPVSALMGKPYIAFDDTEVAVKTRLLHMPFTKAILTPNAFYKDLGSRHIRFNSLMELFYLHDNYFKNESDLLKSYIKDSSNYVILRFVSWEAHHDIGNSGITYQKKLELVDYLTKKYELIISSEGELPFELKKFQMKAPSHLMHHLIANAKFIITEGATMASESVLLGTPAIYINTIQSGNSIEQAKEGLLYSLTNDINIFEALTKLENINYNEDLKRDFDSCSRKYKYSKIDGTAFLIWFAENWPESMKIMKENPGYQYNFR